MKTAPVSREILDLILIRVEYSRSSGRRPFRAKGARAVAALTTGNHFTIDADEHLVDIQHKTSICLLGAEQAGGHR
jgi:hypothetical protein